MHPDDQHDAATSESPVSEGTAAALHPPRPPFETSIDAPYVVAVGLVPAATHHPSGSQATVDSVTVALSDGEPVPSGSGADAVVPHAASNVAAATREIVAA